MSQLQDIEEFLSRSRQVTAAGDLRRLMSEIGREMGFDHFSLLHHVELPRNIPGLDHLLTESFIAMSDYPQAWLDAYTAEGLVSLDPVLQAAELSAGGFAWQEMPRMMAMSGAQQDMMARARREGVGDGFTVPARFAGEVLGSCHFAMKPGRELPQGSVRMAALVGTLAFQAARNLVAAPQRAKEPATPPLTGRQLDCISLIGKGKTDWEIARILGISQETVKQHIRDARARYDVGKRVQLVVRALNDGALELRDLV